MCLIVLCNGIDGYPLFSWVLCVLYSSQALTCTKHEAGSLCSYECSQSFMKFVHLLSYACICCKLLQQYWSLVTIGLVERHDALYRPRQPRDLLERHNNFCVTMIEPVKSLRARLGAADTAINYLQQYNCSQNDVDARACCSV